MLELDSFASKASVYDAKCSLNIFVTWGFLESELQLRKSPHYPKGSYSAKSRLMILQQVAHEKKRFTVNDYLEGCHHSISPRQAQRDLKNSNKIKFFSKTKNRFYKKLG